MVSPMGRGVAELRSIADPRLGRIAVIGALAAALGAAGCGRKGGLDPPPDAALVEPAPAAPPAAAPVLGPDGRPVMPAPPPPKRRFPLLDWLID
jgi:predicted small lipoprotein YifL